MRAWSIADARKESNRLRVTLDSGANPRELDKAKEAAKTEQQAAKAAKTLTVGNLWAEYLETGKPKRRDAWKPRYLEDKLTIADKVEATRTVPLTPYLAQLLATLPRHSEWVFASTRPLKTDTANIKRRD